MHPSPPDTRESLIIRLPNAQDSVAWEQALEIYRPLVDRMARQRGLQGADAEDLVQEVFSAVSRQIESWLQKSERGPFRAWLLRIARNTAINLLTRKPIEGRAVGGLSSQGLSQLAVTAEEFSHSFDVEYQRQVFCWAAERVKNSVSDSTWLAFQLTHIDRMPIADAAEKIGVSIGTVYISRSRVMSRLKTLSRQFEVQS